MVGEGSSNSLSRFSFFCMNVNKQFGNKITYTCIIHYIAFHTRSNMICYSNCVHYNLILLTGNINIYSKAMITVKILCMFISFCEIVFATKLRPRPVFSSCTGRGVTKWNRDLKFIRDYLYLLIWSMTLIYKHWCCLQFGVRVLAAGHGECPGEVSQPPWPCDQPPLWPGGWQFSWPLVLGQWHYWARVHRGYR